MRLNRQLLSKTLSPEAFDNSPSILLKKQILDFAKSVGNINSNSLKKIDAASRTKNYELIFNKANSFFSWDKKCILKY